MKQDDTAAAGAATCELLTIGRAAEMLGVHPQTLRSWERTGRIPKPARTLGGERRYRLEDVQELLGSAA